MQLKLRPQHYFCLNLQKTGQCRALFVDKILKGAQARRSACEAADEVRAGDQSQKRVKLMRLDNSTKSVGPAGHGD
jgi:hypothetical protein